MGVNSLSCKHKLPLPDLYEVSNIAITLGPRPCTTVLGVVHGRGWVSIWLHDKQLTSIEEGAVCKYLAYDMPALLPRRCPQVTHAFKALRF